MTIHAELDPTDIVPLAQAAVEPLFGGKSVNLGAMLRAGLPVPTGWALSWRFARAVSGGDRLAVERLMRLGDESPGLWAIRSSAIGEDAEDASFAGQHQTCLGVTGAHAFVASVLMVERSGSTDSARTYREAKGHAGEARVAVTVQRLLDPYVAGVMFTRNPITGDEERLVEAAFGLGEAVVSSRVTPDTYRVRIGGELITSQAGQKTLSLHPLAGGGIEERRLTPDEAARLTLEPQDLIDLDRLAVSCERTFGGPQDIEWAKAEGKIWLLQSRPITNLG